MAKFIRILGLATTLFFSIGAILGAMVTMYSAVANRTAEIGTLRALGFKRRKHFGGFSGRVSSPRLNRGNSRRGRRFAASALNYLNDELDYFFGVGVRIHPDPLHCGLHNGICCCNGFRGRVAAGLEGGTPEDCRCASRELKGETGRIGEGLLSKNAAFPESPSHLKKPLIYCLGSEFLSIIKRTGEGERVRILQGTAHGYAVQRCGRQLYPIL